MPNYKRMNYSTAQLNNKLARDPGQDQDIENMKVELSSLALKVDKAAMCAEPKEESSFDLDIADEEGNVIARFADGHFKVKNFDSREAATKNDLERLEEKIPLQEDIEHPIEVEGGTGSDLDIADENGNVIAEFKGGHIKTQKFDSRTTGNKIDFSTLKFACFGDSITSDEVTGIGSVICSKLGAIKIGNFAHGNAHCSDWHLGDINNTVITFNTQVNSNTNDNVLSNQVRCMLRHTTPLGSQVSWTHPFGGNFAIDTAVGTGLGNVSDIPDIIYIAISTNDGKYVSGYESNEMHSPTPIVDDCEVVFGQSYKDLSKNSIASALRWGIETLQCAYPKAHIFVASPIQSNYGYNEGMWAEGQFGTKLNWEKRDIIEKVCKFCSVHFVDSFGECGYSNFFAKNGGGIHPSSMWKNYVAEYVANKITNEYFKRF